MIRFACPTCSATFTVGLEKAGKSAKCPKCQTAFLIPDAPVEETLVSPALPPSQAVTAPPSPVVVPPPPPEPVDDGTVEIVPCPKCANRSLVMKEDVNKDIECPSCQTVYRAIRADAPPPPSVEGGTGRKSKLAEIGSGKKKEADGDEDDRPSKRKRNRADDDDDDRPSKRKRNRDDDEDEDDRPSKRKRNRDDDDEDEDDRPSRRRSSSRRRDDDDEDYDRPRRRSGRGGGSRRSGGNGERPVLVTIVAILEFLGAAGHVVYGLFVLIAGSFAMASVSEMADTIPNTTANATARSNVQGAVAFGTGMTICCGVFMLLWSVLLIFAGFGLMKMRRYGNIITWIIAVLSILGSVSGGFATFGARGLMLVTGGSSLFFLAFGVVAIIAMVKHNDEFE